MKKTLALIITAAMLALSLVSCGSFDASKTDLVGEGYITLGDYKKLDINPAEYEVTDADVYAHAVEHLGHSDVGTVDRAAEKFDVVNIAFVGTIDGVEFEGGTSDSTDLVIGAGNFIDGFEDGIIGMNVGETKDVTTTFPEDYGSEELAGKEAVFAITLNTVYDPAILDETREELADGDLRNDVWSAILENVTVNKYPESEVKKLAQNQYDYYEAMYFQWGITDAESVGLTMDSCIESVKSSYDSEFAVYAISEAEGITVTDEEVDAKVDEIVAEYVEGGYTEADAKAMVTKQSAELELLQEKVIDVVIEGLEVTELTDTAEETTAE